MQATLYFSSTDSCAAYPRELILVSSIRNVKRLPEWNSNAVIITWDDSGAWYDYLMPPIISQASDIRNDRLLSPVRTVPPLFLLT